MSKYKAVVIDGKKLIRNFVIGALILAVALLGILYVMLSEEKGAGTDGAGMTAIIDQVLPAVGAANDGVEKAKMTVSGTIGKITDFLFSFNPFDTRTVFSAELPITETVCSSGLVKTATTKIERGNAQPTAPAAATPPPVEEVIPTENQAPIKSIDAAQVAENASKIAIGNQTAYGINIEEMLSSQLSLNMAGDGPKILIVHTHTTEAYAPEGAEVYDREESDRSMDNAQNVVRVGDAVSEIFNSYGLETLHDPTVHDYPSFNGAYAASLNTVEKYLKQYPSIQVVFDIHRDSIVYDDGTKAKVVTEIDGKNAAQLMFVVGTDEGGLYNPDWRENMKLALQFQNAINQKYPKLMRYVNLRKERFNGHTTKGSMIIEVGTSGNSLEEAVYGASCAAKCIGEFLSGLK